VTIPERVSPTQANLLNADYRRYEPSQGVTDTQIRAEARRCIDNINALHDKADRERVASGTLTIIGGALGVAGGLVAGFVPQDAESDTTRKVAAATAAGGAIIATVSGLIGSANDAVHAQRVALDHWHRSVVLMDELRRGTSTSGGSAGAPGGGNAPAGGAAEGGPTGGNGAAQPPGAGATGAGAAATGAAAPTPTRATAQSQDGLSIVLQELQACGDT
jgi:hypothetical protein